MIFPLVEDFALQRIDKGYYRSDDVWEAKWRRRWYILGFIGVGSGAEYCYHGNGNHWYNPTTKTSASLSIRFWLSDKLTTKLFFDKQKQK